MRRLVVALGVVAVVGLGGCGGEPYDDYCAAVAEQREELSRTLGEGGASGLLQALPILTQLAAEAPEDIVDEWERVLTPLEELDAALEDAGVDPAEYDAANPPEGLSAAERSAIEDAATAVGGQDTQAALTSVEQQVRDVCHEPLTL